MSNLEFSKLFESHPSRLVKKGEVLLTAGNKSDEAFYVVSGCLRSYFIDQKGKEHIYQFAPEDWIISDLSRMSKNRPNQAFLNIDAIEDTEVKVIQNLNPDELLKHDAIAAVSAFNKLFNHVHTLQNRIVELMSYTAEERYESFVKMYPSLHNRVPLKMIASYLALTPESLSRVRAERVKKK